MASLHTDPAHRALTAALADQLRDDPNLSSGDVIGEEERYETAATLAVVVRRLGWTPPPPKS